MDKTPPPESTVRFRDSLLAQQLSGVGKWLLSAVVVFAMTFVAIILVRAAS